MHVRVRSIHSNTYSRDSLKKGTVQYFFLPSPPRILSTALDSSGLPTSAGAAVCVVPVFRQMELGDVVDSEVLQLV